MEPGWPPWGNRGLSLWRARAEASDRGSLGAVDPNVAQRACVKRRFARRCACYTMFRAHFCTEGEFKRIGRIRAATSSHVMADTACGRREVSRRMPSNHRAPHAIQFHAHMYLQTSHDVCLV